MEYPKKGSGKSKKHYCFSDFPLCFIYSFRSFYRPIVLFRELSSEVIEHQVLCRNAKIVKHLLNSFRHRARTTHIVFNIFRSFVILQVSFVDYVVNESRSILHAAASAAGSGRSSARWKVKFGKSFFVCRKSSR